MIGIIPSMTKTFEVIGFFDIKELEEGKLYIDPVDERVYLYSSTEKRSNPKSGYFPIWNGEHKYISSFSKNKYLKTDVTRVDLPTLAATIDKETVKQVLYNQRRCDNAVVLTPTIADGDNMFTQCIKGVLNLKRYTLIDLVDLSNPKLDERVISNYYSALTKITFMRLDKWHIWMDIILHLSYLINVFKDDKLLITYRYPEEQFETGIINYDTITKSKDDPFKKIIKILIVMENITKNSLRSKEVDDYTINNMLTTINSNKALSAQLFSRFIRMANFSYDVQLFEKDNCIFQYKEF